MQGGALHECKARARFLTRTIGSPTLASQVNYNPFLIARAIACWWERAHLPNFVTVDFYDIGDLFAAVDEINRDRLFSATPPPTFVPTPTPTPFACSAAPDPNCATSARVALKIRRAGAGATLRFRWNGSVDLAALGDPRVSNDSAFCLYADGQHMLQLDIPAGPARRAGSRGGLIRRYHYRSPEGVPDGIDKATLGGGDVRRAGLKLHARGASLQLPPALTAATVSTRLTAQLIVRDGSQCWSADFTGDAFRGLH